MQKMQNVQNEIFLQFKDGRQISIIQNAKDHDKTKSTSAHGKYGDTVEVWVKGDEEPVSYLTAEELIEFLTRRMTNET